MIKTKNVQNTIHADNCKKVCLQATNKCSDCYSTTLGFGSSMAMYCSFLSFLHNIGYPTINNTVTMDTNPAISVCIEYPVNVVSVLPFTSTAKIASRSRPCFPLIDGFGAPHPLATVGSGVK